MEEQKDKTVLELAHRLNQIDEELSNLVIEYNVIIKELCKRIPALENDENIKMKKIKRKGE